jgi:hypothetical protein
MVQISGTVSGGTTTVTLGVLQTAIPNAVQPIRATMSIPATEDIPKNPLVSINHTNGQIEFTSSSAIAYGVYFTATYMCK